MDADAAAPRRLDALRLSDKLLLLTEIDESQQGDDSDGVLKLRIQSLENLGRYAEAEADCRGSLHSVSACLVPITSQSPLRWMCSHG